MLRFLTRKIISTLVALLLGATAAWSAEPGALKSLRAIQALSSTEASRALPVAFEGVVTYYNRNDVNLFIEDQGAAIYVETVDGQHIVPGDRVLVQGKTHNSFRTEIVAERITVIGKGMLPDSRGADFNRMIRGDLDCMRVKIRATVASSDIVAFQGQRSIYMRLRMEGGFVGATVFSTDVAATRQLRGAAVEVTGVVAGKFDNKNQLTGILLEIVSLSDIRILKPAVYTPESLPITPMDQVLAGYHVIDQSRLVRVRGTITYFEPGSVAILQNGDKNIWITTRSEEPLRIGNAATATGFPDINGDLLALTDGVIHDTGVASPVLPRPVSQTEMASGNYARDLVSIEGKVIAQVRQAAQDEYVLTANGQVFSAIYHHSAAMATQDSRTTLRLPINAIVRVTGISMANYGSNPFQLSQGPVSFSLLLRSTSDIQIVAKPPWRTVRNLTGLLAVLVLLVVVIGVRYWLLDRKLHRQTLALAARSEVEAALEHRMAQLEQRRSRILEDINRSRPLSEIIEQITQLVSFTLNGERCRCELSGGAPQERAPADSASKRVVRQKIISHSGLVLGVLSAELDKQNRSVADETEALAVGTQLATLAIETRRIYSDLVYRSTFDLLTDSHNRSSLEESLDVLIEMASQNTRIFGLVYIDLDNFKSVNDLFGHHVGDAFLREAAARMSRQLRADDLLARVGGDEFVVLLPTLRSYAEIAEIAQRLENSFTDPLCADGHVLQGSASVGYATYPKDGATRDSLLKAADAAMYVAKQTKPHMSGMAVRPAHANET